jgi:Phytanoyl-CoA dioxygenase (PhyH)
MLTAGQREEFDRLGLVRIPAAVARNDALEMCDQVWDALRVRHRILREDPKTWKGRRLTGTHHLPKSVTFEKAGSSRVCEALDDLLGAQSWHRPERWGSLLVVFPDGAHQWQVPHKNWHLDFPAMRSLTGLFAVRLFTCLAKLEPGGGGTLFLAGSHRLVQRLAEGAQVERIRSADARKALIRNYPWVKELCSLDEKADRVRHFMDTATAVDGVELRVVEMTGDPGDVVLAHPMMLHAPAGNSREVPRIVLTATLFRAGVPLSAIYEPAHQ